MTSTFGDRLAAPTRFELEVVERLNATGYHAWRFGQALLDDSARDLLKQYRDGSGHPCLLRWMPDVIAFRVSASGRVWLALIDAKVCNGPNYAVEISAVETLDLFVDRLYTPTFFVFDDWKVLTPREVRQRSRHGPQLGNGSGTAFWIVEKRFGSPFDSVFVPVTRNSQT